MGFGKLATEDKGKSLRDGLGRKLSYVERQATDVAGGPRKGVGWVKKKRT